MYKNKSTVDNFENQQLNEDLYCKYNLQEIDAEILIQKYHHASKKMQKMICTIFKERGFNRNEIKTLFKQK